MSQPPGFLSFEYITVRVRVCPWYSMTLRLKTTLQVWSDQLRVGEEACLPPGHHICINASKGWVLESLLMGLTHKPNRKPIGVKSPCVQLCSTSALEILQENRKSGSSGMGNGGR